jgi:hypothetical protein
MKTDKKIKKIFVVFTKIQLYYGGGGKIREYLCKSVANKFDNTWD